MDAGAVVVIGFAILCFTFGMGINVGRRQGAGAGIRDWLELWGCWQCQQHYSDQQRQEDDENHGRTGTC